MKNNKTYKYIIAIILIAFALVIIFMGSSVLFDWFGIRANQGNYVPFVVKTNLTVAFIYLLAVYGFLHSKKWASWAMLSAALLLVYALTLLYLHIHSGGPYETRTVAVLIFRILFTLVFAGLLSINFDKKRTNTER
ncbi:hypothetical protein [Aequorivita marina]|uniref:hypothetical protein n=1 Tax=Aequorivita marina TaxID=3073654 RepID=UPI0028745D82|nr:hypothetical protein [Aequorivita sp. S2608]MDS1298668.1 hypothetical protein [Aequorivita sp. S2608]